MNNKNIKYIDDKISYLSKDLKIDKDHILNTINDIGWTNTAVTLGYNITNYDNLRLAGRMAIANLKEDIGNNYDNYLIIMEERMKTEIYSYIVAHRDQLQEAIDKQEDLDHDWFSANSLLRTYLSKKDDKPFETPSQLWMRVAVTLRYKHGVKEVIKVFKDLSDGYYIMASPTLFNAGMKKGQMSSCFLMSVEDDLIECRASIYDRLKDSAGISKNMGANGIDVSRWRHGLIGFDGKSNGIIPFVQLFNTSTRAVNQNGKRKGATTMYIRMHHIDIYEFCELSLKTGEHYTRAHDINTALWTPWLFWKRLNEDGDWSLFCPADTKDLNDIWGIEWAKRYEEYEKDLSIPRKTVKAIDLMKHITSIQRKSGMPYILHGDSINMKCNQKNLGYIRCSNLCLEITEFTSRDEIASCNLASISLRKFVTDEYDHMPKSYGDIYDRLTKCYDFNKLGKITRSIVSNINSVIDENNYFNDSIKLSNDRHRPIGIGVSGLSDALNLLDIPFQDPKNPKYVYSVTKQLNKMIFACMYWNSLARSTDLAIRYGKYQSFDGSPLSNGKFQFDLWKEEYEVLKDKGFINNAYRKDTDDDIIEPIFWGQKEYKLSNGDKIEPTWKSLREAICKYGIRNSLLIALMPTATSSQPLMNAETVEAHQSNIYSRKIMNGAYPVVNRHMVKDLEEIGLWYGSTITLIKADEGSIGKLKEYVLANLDKYPDFDKNNIKRLDWIIQKYKTMWELSVFIFLDMAADRGRYVCQSQSTNVYMHDPTDAELVAVHNYANAIGLKTGMYYLRQSAARAPINITVDPSIYEFIPSDIIETIDININEEEIEDKDPNRLTISNKISKQEFDRQVICNDEICVSCQ